MPHASAISRRTATRATVLGLLSHAIGPSLAGQRSAGSQDPYALAVQQFRAGRWSSAYGIFTRLANQGDPDAARISLFMLRYGPSLYDNHWDASTDEVADWTELATLPKARPQPAFDPRRHRVR